MRVVDYPVPNRFLRWGFALSDAAIDESRRKWREYGYNHGDARNLEHPDWEHLWTWLEARDDIPDAWRPNPGYYYVVLMRANGAIVPGGMLERHTVHGLMLTG